VYDARFEDIVPDQRIVSTYAMYMAELRISVSVATVELTQHGTGELLNALGKVVEGTR
jgi:uncharacterized protein YndB with AHSA1/START domain